MIDGASTALVLFFASLSFFFYLGYRRKLIDKSSDDFWYAGRNISSKSQYFTWFASTIAFSSAILYYMQVASIWGYWIYIGSIGSYITGQLISIYLVSRSKVNLREFETLGKFVEERSGSKNLGWVIDIMNTLQLFALVYIEIGLGVKIFTGLFTFQGSALPFEIFAFLALASVPYFYIKLGGFSAIVGSDLWQGLLIILGLFCLIIYFLIYHSADVAGNVSALFPAPIAGGQQIFAYIVFACLVNLVVGIAQMAVWQRLSAASESENRYRLAGVGVLCAGLVFCFYIALASVYLTIGNPIEVPSDLYLPIVESGGFAAKFLFPLVFVGFLAALISSADSASMTGTMTIFGRESRTLQSTEWEKSKGKALMGLMFALGALFLFHIYIETIGSGFANVFLSIIFYLFSQLALAAPVVAVAALAPTHLRDSRTIILGLITSWVALTIGYAFPTQLTSLIPSLEPYFVDQYTGGMWTTLLTLTLVTLATYRLSSRMVKE